MYDLTTQVMSIVKESGIRNGIVNVFNVGSTAGIGTIEFEPGLSKDMINVLDRL
ncbi:MAG TPA: YjbQ family protein, partial [Verrucomicrobiota bacterium]|nr:YjbQ family protein [Verrucomicrobiota bacterium]